MKKLYLLILMPLLIGCAELQQIADQLPNESIYVTDSQIAAGLRQALNMGIERQVSQLGEQGGFFRNEQVRITLPPELQKVDRTLRSMGMDALADQGLKVLNQAAEEAVQKATPIFVDAVQDINFQDARQILTGDQTAATDYLAGKTTSALYNQFHPVIENSLDRVGATAIWKNLIERYNEIPLTTAVNPDLPDYVTREALEGVFTMIAVEEKQIRTDLDARTTDLLRRVFAIQD